MTRLIEALQKLLVEPPGIIADVAYRHRSRLLNIFLLIMTVVFAGVDLTYLATIPGYVPTWYGYVFLLGSYGLNHSRFYRRAAFTTLIMFPVVILISIIAGEASIPVITLYYLIPGLILGSILMTAPATGIFALIEIAVIFSMPLVDPKFFRGFGSIVGPLASLVICAVLVLVSMRFRDLIEADRQVVLMTAEEKYREIFENAAEGIFQSTVDGQFLSVNPAMARMYGFQTPAEMIQAVTDISQQLYVDPERRSELRRHLADRGRISEFESLEYRKDGSAIWTSTNARSVRDARGRVVYFEGTVEDITPRKRVEAERESLIRELATKNAESETLRESTAIVAATLEISETVQRILEQLKRVVPYDSASVWLYKTDIAVMVGSDGLPAGAEKPGYYTLSEAQPDYPFRIINTPNILYTDIQELYPQFREPPLDYIHGWMAVPLLGRGKLTGFISLDSRTPGQYSEHDAQLVVTYANQVSIALENSRLLGELQTELKVRQSLIDELEAKNVELERFTYTVSHDLKSPLVTIRGFLGLVEQDLHSRDGAHLDQDMQRIIHATDKMYRMLEELLELSRIGRVKNASEVIPFEDLVRAALENVEGRLVGRGIHVIVRPGLAPVFGDRQRLTEVLQNLIDNAAKFLGPQKEPQIEIGQETGPEGNPVYFVRDNGVGIAPEYRERIFGLFDKLDLTSDGTGIGLAIVKRVIEVHGGRIWVESVENQGATFFFTLPQKPG